MLREQLPSWIRTWHRRRHHQRLLEEWGVRAKADKFAAEHGLTVRAGPFAGMALPPEAVGWEMLRLIATLEGTYEREIYPYLDDHRGLFVDIGSAEGTFLVGMALRGCRSIGFEIDSTRRRRSRRLAELNGVSQRLAVHGEFRPEGLELDGALVLVDIEGAEAELIPRYAPWFAESRLIVEFHDGSEDAVIAALEKTHTVTVVPFVRAPDRPDELRPGDQAWGVFEPRG